MKYFKCGTILTTHGLKGDLKIKELTDFDRFYKGSRLYILHNNNYEQVVVSHVSDFGNYLLVRFQDKEDINLVEKYHSNDIYVSELDRKNELENGEYYYSDLIGKTVCNEKGEEKGKVVEVRELPQAHYLVVLNNDKKSLVPFIKEFIISVDDEKIIVKEIEGLF